MLIPCGPIAMQPSEDLCVSEGQRASLAALVRALQPHGHCQHRLSFRPFPVQPKPNSTLLPGPLFLCLYPSGAHKVHNDVAVLCPVQVLLSPSS